MNKEIKAKWLAALRSGDYMQYRGQLRHTAYGETGELKYCCLGVLCDVYNSKQWEGNIYESATCTLSTHMQQVTELGRGNIEELIHLNDAVRWDFNQIADWIEEHL